jgi:pimeloyl-ACP methyl ester carboxylesterase/class 3 adenylate cyclase
MSPETRYAKNGDVYIAYQVTGGGPDTLVYAPGTVSHLDLDWEFPLRAELFRRLSSMFRLVRFDKRGTGLSDRPTAMATLEQRADDIRAVMDAAGIDAAYIFGMSEGASMAALFAATHPQRTRALLIWGGMARFVATADHPWGLSRDEADRLIQDVQDHWPSEWYIRGPGVGLGPGADDALVQLCVRYGRAAASPSAAAAYERMNAEIDIRPILGAIKVPTLVMNRTGDPVAACDGARDMASRIPGARFVEFPGDTHALMTIAPERVFAEIEAFVTGARPIEVDDRVLATILFVDVANSTQALSALGDSAWKMRLEDYYRVVRQELGRYRGRETNTAGDGFMASFDGPGRAIWCALAIVAAVKPLGLEVRAGLHTGEVELMGDNIGGIAVHIAARVIAEAAAGEVLVSSTTKDLVAGSGIALEPRGSRLLKGVPGEWALFAAKA